LGRAVIVVVVVVVVSFVVVSVPFVIVASVYVAESESVSPLAPALGMVRRK